MKPPSTRHAAFRWCFFIGGRRLTAAPKDLLKTSRHDLQLIQVQLEREQIQNKAQMHQEVFESNVFSVRTAIHGRQAMEEELSSLPKAFHEAEDKGRPQLERLSRSVYQLS